MGRGLDLGKIGGVEVVLDWSLLIVFALITVALGSGLFAEWHADWGPALVWGTSIVAAVSFIAAVLVHELSHAWVGRARGVAINRIVLFVFGGMAQMEGEPRRWQDEFWMAIVGPVTSAVIGIVCIVLGAVAAGDVGLAEGNIEETIRELGPVASLLFWLGPVNIVLALFNLVPGFPLDGGRVLRAALWGWLGDLKRATRWASNAGRVFAGLLILSGFAMMLGLDIPVFGTGFASGVWIALIGWFLHNAAITSFRQLVLRETLEDVAVERIMLTDIASVPSRVSVSAFVDDHLMKSEQHAFPVIDDGEFVGLVRIDDIRAAPRSEWDATPVGALMTPARELRTLDRHAGALDALTILNQGRVREIPIVDAGDGRLIGLLTHENLIKWLTVHGNQRPMGLAGP